MMLSRAWTMDWMPLPRMPRRPVTRNVPGRMHDAREGWAAGLGKRATRPMDGKGKVNRFPARHVAWRLSRRTRRKIVSRQCSQPSVRLSSLHFHIDIVLSLLTRTQHPWRAQCGHHPRQLPTPSLSVVSSC